MAAGLYGLTPPIQVNLLNFSSTGKKLQENTFTAVLGAWVVTSVHKNSYYGTALCLLYRFMVKVVFTQKHSLCTLSWHKRRMLIGWCCNNRQQPHATKWHNIVQLHKVFALPGTDSFQNECSSCSTRKIVLVSLPWTG